MIGTAVILVVAVVFAAADDSGRARPLEDGDRGGPNRPLLREGTRIPPTAGRFRRVGRRWEFVSDAAEELADAKTEAEDARFEDARLFDDRKAPNRDADATTPTATGGVSADAASASETRPEVPRMLVVENLMLQRIEEAVRDDPAANRWNVTGVVTEYQNENRLIVTTAERADAR